MRDRVNGGDMRAVADKCRAKRLMSEIESKFEWVLKNARDPAQIAVARRELGF